MNCERYKNALLDAAARSEKPDAKLARHLERCTRCRATLQAERELFSRIDITLRSQVNESPQAGFLAKVRVQLSRETSADAGSNPMWSVTGAALAVVLIAMIYPLVNARQPRIQGNLQAPSMGASQSAGLRQSARAAIAESDVGSRQHFSRHSESKNAIQQEPEVLVPPDEQQAFAQFVARVAGRDAIAEAAVSRAVDKTVARKTDLPQVPSVDMADLVLERPQLDEWMNDSGGSE